MTPEQLAAALAAHHAGAKAVHMHPKTADGWTVLPDFASVNWHEPGSEELARLLLSKGLDVEVGLFHAEAAASWASSEIAQHCLRVMIEPPPGVGGGFTGAGAAARPGRELLVAAGTRRGARAADPIGMEETLLLPDGSATSGNAALVSAAVQLLSR